ncbi:hypothetical protein Bca52824_077602 [Brassica carinata]|uniref:Uncharacterized protein n=1 Tax=Brassica carinata TaxID=52824 RepID=A0A8X7PWD8_BRACI|nr:hypothetical protein Bca52824_077602 [Brassica carinata]
MDNKTDECALPLPSPPFSLHLFVDLRLLSLLCPAPLPCSSYALLDNFTRLGYDLAHRLNMLLGQRRDRCDKSLAIQFRV